MPYTLEDAEALKAELATMPDADNKKKALTKRGAVAVLSEELRRMHSRKGYSTNELAALLTAKGLAITPQTLRSYLRAKKVPRPGNKRPTRVGTPVAHRGTNAGQRLEAATAPPKATFRPREDSDEI